METLGLKNVNMLSKEQYNTVAEPAKDELWLVETETYSDDDGNWYRVYPDGWCEQGGRANSKATINLLKSFINTTYLINATITNDASTSARNFGYLQTYNKTTTNFKIDEATYSGACCWYACGYIA